MAKLNRESKLRDKRVIKAAKKEARKREAAIEGPSPADEAPLGDAGFTFESQS